MKNILREIEEKYPVDTVKVNGHEVWPYLRYRYFIAYRAREARQRGERRYPKSSASPRRQELMRMAGRMLRQVRLLGPARRLMKGLRRILRPLRLHIFYGFKNWFNKYDYIVLSHSGMRRNIDGKNFNILLDPVIDRLGRDKALCIETPTPSYHSIDKVYTKHIVPRDLLRLFTVALARVAVRKPEIQNRAILESIQRDCGLNVDDRRWIKHFDAERKVFSLLLRVMRPRAVLLTMSMSYYAAIKAAKDLGIAVVEFQHGTIGKEQPGYNIGTRVDRSWFPDYLLVFGARDRQPFENSYFIEPENVLPIGSFYIDHVIDSWSPQAGLVEKLQNYNHTVGVTLQWTHQKRTIEFVARAAALDPRVFYLLVPRLPVTRTPEETEYLAAKYRALQLPGNAAVVLDKDFYELMMYVDFHATVYSTCALEAPSLGAQNVLINIDNLSSEYFETLLTDSRITRYADTPEEFAQTIDTFPRLDRDTVRKLNEDIIATDYDKNIEKVINEHILDGHKGRRR